MEENELTEEQHEKLSTFMALTGRSDVEALHFLEAFAWDVHGAVNNALAEHEALPSVPVASSSTSDSFMRRDGNEANPRGWGLLGSGLVANLVNSVWNLGVRGIHVAEHLLPAPITHTVSRVVEALLPGVGGVAPQSVPTDFTAAFEGMCGERRHPRFFPGHYREAMEEARQRFKFLLVYLHADAHNEAPAFCRDTLSNEALAAFIDENFIFWAGSVSTVEAFQLSLSLGVDGYPYLGVLLVGSRGIQLINMMEGFLSAEDVMANLVNVLENQGPALVAEQAEQEDRALSRTLREQQDRAYADALQAEREKERQVREEREAQEAAERRAQEEEQRQQEIAKERELRRIRKKETLESEPPEGSAGLANVVVRLPDGTRVARRYRASDPLQLIVDVLEIRGFDMDDYHLATSFPKRTFEDLCMTLEEADLVPSGQLLVISK